MRPNPAKLEHAGAGAGRIGGGGAPAATSSVSSADARERARGGLSFLAAVRRRPELLALLVLAGGLYLWALSRNGWANTYYSAAVRSMSTSWHDFLYGSFDSSGLMTVDKPPLALWVQALSVRVFGFHSLSILVPQALMGVASAGLTYDVVRRHFGRAAGFVAGLTLVLTPVTVAISRHNNPDALLVLCSVAALWFLVRGLEDGRTRWIVLAGVMVGLGFETKMGAALLVVPGIALAWLWISPRGRGLLDAAKQLTLGGIAMAAVGLAWPLLMWLTPAADRPWIGGTSDNSIWSLITGYNGLGRLDGQAGGPGGGGGAAGGIGGAIGGGGGAPGGIAGVAGGPGGGGGGAGSVFGGDAGPLRLLGESLGGQVGWLLGVALVGGIALLVATRLRRGDLRSGWLIAVGGAFATSAVAFSFAEGIFHPYYVSALAPFAGALAGATVGLVQEGGLRARIVGAAAVVAGAVTTLAVLHSTGDMGWLAPLVVLGGGATLVALLLPSVTARLRNAALVAMLALLLFAPASWAVQTLGHATSGTFPAGGPASQGTMGGPGGRGGPGGGGPGGGGAQAGQPGGGFVGPPGATQGGPAGAPSSGAFGGGGFGGEQSLTEALAFVKAHGGGTIAISGQQGAAASIISSDADVAGIGGFSGRESEVSVDWLANAVASGKIRWVIVSSSGGGVPSDGRTGATTALDAAEQVGAATTVDGLYDLQGTADALRALG